MYREIKLLKILNEKGDRNSDYVNREKSEKISEERDIMLFRKI